MRLRRLIYLLAVAAVAAAILIYTRDGDGVPAPRGAPGVHCDEVTGPDEDPARFFERLGSGETGCLREGAHTATGTVAITDPDVVLTSYPGESATLVGRLWVEEGADGATIEDLTLDGRNDEALPSPTVNADDVVFRNNDISNDHTAICFGIGDHRFGVADRTLIEDNRIHDCGRLPATNKDHGIYVAHATDTVIRGNVIYANADRGVQLYPDADDTLVTGNVIDGNGQGVIFGGGPDSSSDNNLITRNVISNSTIRFNIQSHWQGPTGSGNVARDNCVWSDETGYYGGSPPGSGIEPAIDGAEAADNVVADPGYIDAAAGDLRVEGEIACEVPAAASPRGAGD